MTPTVTASMPASGRSLASAPKKKPSKPPVRRVQKRNVKVPTSTAHRERSILLSVAGPATSGRDDATLSCHLVPPIAPDEIVALARARGEARAARDLAPADRARALNGVRAHAPAGTQVVVVADAPSRGQAAALEALERGAGDPDEVVWTSARLGRAAALNAGIRRASGAVVILLDTSVEPKGDVVTPLVAALADPSVAVAGGWGVATHDLRHFQEAGPGDVAAVEGSCLAFRRVDYVARGPFDEHFRFYRNLDIWWSLVLRDEGEEARPRRAVTLPLPTRRHEHRGWTSVPDAERDRLSRRNFYRIIDRFGWRNDLLVDRS